MCNSLVEALRAIYASTLFSLPTVQQDPQCPREEMPINY